MFSDREKADAAVAAPAPASQSATSSSAMKAASPAPPAQVIHRFTIVPSGRKPTTTSTSSTRSGVPAKAVRSEYGVAEDLSSSLLDDERLFSFFPSAECGAAPPTLNVDLPKDLFALQAIDEALDNNDDAGGDDDEPENASPTGRVAVMSGSGTRGTAKSLQWALRKLQERTAYSATVKNNSNAADRASHELQLHATPVSECKELTCVLLRLPAARDAPTTPTVVAASIVDGPLLGLYCDRLAPVGGAARDDRGISSAWEHQAVKVKRGDWKDMDAIVKDEAQDRGRLQMVLDEDEPAKAPATKRAKTESTTTKASAPTAGAKRASKPAAVKEEAVSRTTVPAREQQPTPVVPKPSAPAAATAAAAVAAPSPPPLPAPAPAPASDGATDASAPVMASDAQFATVAEAVLLELRHGGKHAASFKDWQKLVLKRLPEYREISQHMKSSETRHVATQWFEQMKERLRVWLTATKGFLMDPQGNVVGY